MITLNGHLSHISQKIKYLNEKLSRVIVWHRFSNKYYYYLDKNKLDWFYCCAEVESALRDSDLFKKKFTTLVSPGVSQENKSSSPAWKKRPARLAPEWALGVCVSVGVHWSFSRVLIRVGRRGSTWLLPEFLRSANPFRSELPATFRCTSDRPRAPGVHVIASHSRQTCTYGIEGGTSRQQDTIRYVDQKLSPLSSVRLIAVSAGHGSRRQHGRRRVREPGRRRRAAGVREEGQHPLSDGIPRLQAPSRSPENVPDRRPWRLRTDRP